jgi:parallel beta helix pectate lyase-like protein
MAAPRDPTDNRTRSAANRMTLTVGVDSSDLVGSDDRTIQAGVDYLSRLGGGTLQLSAGEFLLRNAVFLRPHITVRGMGADTVLRKAAGACSPLARDSDWYESRVVVEDGRGFTPGCGIMLRSHDHGRMEVVKDTVVATDGNELLLSRRLEKNGWLEHDTTAATIFPLLTAENVDDVTVEDLVLDGNMAQNEEINGNYAGAVFIQYCDRFVFRRVTARNYNGDGFSFQVCDDIRFLECRAQDNANLGFHPGSGSQRPLFDRCVSSGNSQGIFFCWGVTHGLARDCTCRDNRDYGISIGHRDTDNRISGCVIERNHKVGVLFREQTAFRSGHRNLIEHCTINDNGFAEAGVGIDVRGPVEGLVLRHNHFGDSGHQQQRIGVRLAPTTGSVEMAGNSFTGLSTEVDSASA